MATRTESKIAGSAVRNELDRILQSPLFVQSDRLARFLRFTVEHAINNTDEPLKEFIIGTEVYDRRPPYHPSLDSIVRTEARRLRSKLKEYYESDGKDDPIFIYFRLGSYVPVFRMKDSETSYQVAVGNSSNELFIEGAGVSVAVIPFLDLSGQPLSSKYARGVTDELIHELMQSEGCRVVSASSVTRSGLEPVDVPALARKLGVQVVFEGTVREEGSLVRVTARIVNADGFQIWSQRLDAEVDLSSQFAVQEQFASALVSRVRPQQSNIRAARASVGPSALNVLPSIYKGEALLEEGTPADTHAAIAKFREVTVTASGYGRPYCGIAQGNIWLALHGAVQSTNLVAQARAAAQRALDIDPHMVEAIASMGSVEASEWNWRAAEASFQRAIESGSNATAERQYAMLLTILGRFDEAWLYLESAQQVDPFSNQQRVTCARFFYFSRRYAEALEYFAEPLRYGPVPLESRLYLALIHAQLGDYAEARNIAEKAHRMAGAQLPLRAWVAEIYAYAQEHTLAEAAANAAGLKALDAQLSRYRQALLAICLGDKEGALSLLHDSYHNRDAELPYLAVDPRFDPLRTMPPFLEIVKNIRSAKR